MLDGFYASMADTPVAVTILAIAIMLMGGFGMTRLTKLCRLPNVTGYILAGILMGPYCLGLVPSDVVSGMDFLADIALALIAFGMGEFFRFSVLRKNGPKVALCSLIEVVAVAVVAFLVCFFLLGLGLSLSLVLASLAMVTAPTSTVMTIRQTGAKGPFVNTLLEVMAVDDIVGLVCYSVALTVAVSADAVGGGSGLDVIVPLLLNLAMMALGGIFGVFFRLLMPAGRSTDNRLIISVALLFAFCGVCAILDVSPLLGCMAMGTVYANMAEDDKLFKQLNYFRPPLLLLFFVRSGIVFRIDVLFSGGSFGYLPLILVAVIYFAVRGAGKVGGAALGSAVTGQSASIRKYLGLALIPQAGVSIGLAALGARMLGGNVGSALETVVVAAGVLYELVGPPLAKLALYLSHSYGTALEELAPVERVGEDGAPKNEVELLIERIQAIREALPPHTESEEERAFTEAAEEQYEMHRSGPGRMFGRRR